MNIDVLLMLLLILATLVVFALELFPIEVTAMGMLVVLLILGFVEPDQALAGLSNKAVAFFPGVSPYGLNPGNDPSAPPGAALASSG